MLHQISKTLTSNGCLHRQMKHKSVQNGTLTLSRVFGLRASSPNADRHEVTPDYFHLLGVDHKFNQSTDELKSKYKRLMTKFHPDKHALSSEADKETQASMASNVTRAYSVIEDPLLRALHMLEHRGAAMGESENIMEVREEVENASSDDELRPLLKSCQNQQSELCEELAKSFEEDRIDDAKYQTAKLQYWNRIETTIMEKISSVA